MKIEVSRRWIASSNREWGASVPGKGWLRGGSLGDALKKAAEGLDGDIGGTIKVLPDTTSKQAEDAHRRFFGG